MTGRVKIIPEPSFSGPPALPGLVEPPLAGQARPSLELAHIEYAAPIGEAQPAESYEAQRERVLEQIARSGTAGEWFAASDATIKGPFAKRVRSPRAVHLVMLCWREARPGMVEVTLDSESLEILNQRELDGPPPSTVEEGERATTIASTDDRVKQALDQGLEAWPLATSAPPCARYRTHRLYDVAVSTETQSAPRWLVRVNLTTARIVWVRSGRKVSDGD